MRARGCGRLALPLLLLSAAALAEGDAKGLKEGETPGNFMEDEQWLSSISQYSGKIKHWNRFRDVSLQGQGSARGLGRELGSRDPGARSGGCPWQPRAPAAQPGNCTESKQRAPTGLLNPFLIFRSAPELATPSPIHTCPERGVALGACVSDQLSSAGWMRRGVRDAEGRGRRQAGRDGSPGFEWVPDLFFFWRATPRCPQGGWMLQVPHTGHCGRGRSGWGRRGRQHLPVLALYFHLGLWAGGDRKDRPTVGALSWGQGGALSNPPKGEMVKGVSVRP